MARYACALIFLVALLVPGCALVNDANRLGADFDLGLGGGYLASVIGDVHLKAGVAIERSGADEEGPDAGAAGGDRGFL